MKTENTVLKAGPKEINKNNNEYSSQVDLEAYTRHYIYLLLKHKPQAEWRSGSVLGP
jgi:hypothetical protein